MVNIAYIKCSIQLALIWSTFYFSTSLHFVMMMVFNSAGYFLQFPVTLELMQNLEIPLISANDKLKDGNNQAAKNFFILFY